MFLPENIDLANSEKYCLSIRLAPNGFSFCIDSPFDPSVFYFQDTSIGSKLSYLESIKKIVFDLGVFSNSFNRCSVFVVSQNYTLIPNTYFDQKQSEKLFRFTFHDSDGIILNDKSLNDYHIVYNLDEDVYSFLVRHLCNPTFHHHSTSLIHSFQKFERNIVDKECFIDFHDDFITVVCLSGNRLISANTFAETNSFNITYYVMSIWEKLNFNHDEDKLYLSGKVDLRIKLGDELKNLIRNIENLELTTKMTLSLEDKNRVPTDLIAALCV